MTHKLVTRNPQSEARRTHVHGPLVPLDEPAPFTPRWFSDLAAVALAFLVIAGIAVILP